MKQASPSFSTRISHLLTPDRSAYAVPDHLPILPVLVVLTDIAFLLAVYLAVVLPAVFDSADLPHYGYSPTAPLITLILTCSFLALLLCNFALAALTDPGRVPRSYPWDPTKTDPGLSGGGDGESDALLPPSRGVEKKIDGRTRFCKTCNVYKPDRTHHCRKLGRCVLEMDHWCSWLRNTIGYRNKKFFFLLVLYSSLTLLVYLISIFPFFIDACIATEATALHVFVIVVTLMALLQYLPITLFLLFHLYMALQGYTTIEFREKRGALESKTTKTGVPIKSLYQSSPYDLGWLGNLQHLLGPNPLLWLVPTRVGMSDGGNAGVVFSVRPGHPLAQRAAIGA